MSNARRIVVSLLTLALVGVSAVAVGAPREKSPISSNDAPIPLADPGTFLGSCDSNADCATGLYCYAFKKQGGHCTKACSSDEDCPAPSHGCTERNQCGLPR